MELEDLIEMAYIVEACFKAYVQNPLVGGFQQLQGFACTYVIKIFREGFGCYVFKQVAKI